MNARIESPVEEFSRFSRRNLVLVFGIVLLLGGTGLALVFSSDGAVARSSARVGWILPILIAIVVGTQTRSKKWTVDSPEVKAALADEWRVSNMAKASRVALVVLLIAQWPLALVFGLLANFPAHRTAMGMAIASITLGLLTMIGTFLYLDRE